eukprot:Skav203073  [mRNA]  locus=scaffold363:109052:127607:- [translate_table: standard]
MPRPARGGEAGESRRSCYSRAARHAMGRNGKKWEEEAFNAAEALGQTGFYGGQGFFFGMRWHERLVDFAGGQQWLSPKKLFLLSLTAALISHWSGPENVKKENDLSYAYWALNGDKTLGADETFGLLKEEMLADLEVEPDRTVNFLRRAVELELKRPLKALARAFAAIQDDTVVTWGAAEFGGDSRSVQRQLTDVMQVYVSEFACAAITNDGTVVSWGSAIAGGDNHDVRNKLVNVREITATNSAFAAIKLDGSVISWGDPRNGGCCEEVQKELFDVQKIFASSTAFAAIRSDGIAVTWGAKNGGGDSQAWQWLGPILAMNQETCRAVQSQLFDVKQIHSSSVAFAAVREDGSVVTWGAVTGASCTGGDSSQVRDKLHDVVQLCSSEGAFAAIKNDGSLIAWGSPEAGGDASGHAEEILVCASRLECPKTRSSVWSPRSDLRSQSVTSTPSRGPEMTRSSRPLVASPVPLSGISTIGAMPSQVRARSSHSQQSHHSGVAELAEPQARQTRSFTPPGVVVPAWAWLPSTKTTTTRVPQNPVVLKALPTPNRSRSQRTPLRVIQTSLVGHQTSLVNRGSLKATAVRDGQKLRCEFSHLLPEVAISPGAKDLASSEDVELKKELYRIRDGSQIFFHILKPKTRPITHALVFLHGYSSTGDLYMEFLAELARSGIMVLVPDLPCHGRSERILV